MPKVDLRDENLRKEYSSKYFNVLKTTFSYANYKKLVDLENDKSREDLHTYEYWWIKYKMVKRFIRVTKVEIIDEKEFEKQRYSYRAFEKTTDILFDDFKSNNSKLDPRILLKVRNFIRNDLELNWKILGNKLVNSNGDYFVRGMYSVNDNWRIKELVEKQKDFYSSEWHITSKLILSIADYFEKYDLSYASRTETEKSIVEYVKNKLRIKEKIKNFFNNFYKSEKVTFEFDDVFNKYGPALFDFHPYDISKEVDFKVICPYDSISVNVAESIVVDYLIGELFKEIREYESLLNVEIIIDSRNYWSYIKETTESFLFHGCDYAFDDNWWLGFSGSCLSSKISLVPYTIFEKYENKIREIQ